MYVQSYMFFLNDTWQAKFLSGFFGSFIPYIASFELLVGKTISLTNISSSFPPPVRPILPHFAPRLLRELRALRPPLRLPGQGRRERRRRPPPPALSRLQVGGAGAGGGPKHAHRERVQVNKKAIRRKPFPWFYQTFLSTCRENNHFGTISGNFNRFDNFPL